MLIDWLLKWILPPFIPKAIEFILYGNKYISGSWVVISYVDEKCEEENQYGVVEIKKLSGLYQINGTTYSSIKTSKTAFYPHNDTFKGIMCQLNGNTLDFVSTAGDAGKLKRTQAAYTFEKFGIKPPRFFDGYSILNSRRLVRGKKITLSKLWKLRRMDIEFNQAALNEIIPELQNTYKKTP